MKRRNPIAYILGFIVAYALLSSLNINQLVRSSIDSKIEEKLSADANLETSVDEANVEATKTKIEAVGDKIGDFFSSALSNSLENSNIPSTDTNEVAAVDNNLEPAKLIAVIDGDTLLVEKNGIEVKVRLIGMDTPESVHSDESKNTVYGTYASDYTKALLESNDYIYLQYDKEAVDQYGRTLAYVWLKDNVDVNSVDDVKDSMLNAILVKDGYAMSKVYGPNDEYAEVFGQLKEEAKTNLKGLWTYDEFKDLWK
jgi:micrococcal nuclease